VASALSALVPGAGQWYTGRRVKAVLFFLPGIVLLGALAVLAAKGRVAILSFAVRPAVIWAFLAVNAAALVWRLWALIDAYRSGDAAAVSRRGWTTAAVFAIVLVTVAPHALLTSYGLEAIWLLQSVFSEKHYEPVEFEAVGPNAPFAPDDLAYEEIRDPALRPLIGVPHVHSARNMIFWDGVGDPDAIAVLPEILGGPPPDLRTLIPTEERHDLERITILLAGGDGGPGRGGTRTDSINVATLDTTTGKAVVFGIPRNLVQVPLREDYADAFVDLEKRITPRSDPRWVDTDGDGRVDDFVSCHCFPDQINAIYPYTRKWTETYPNERDPGMAVLRDTLELMLGLDIDYYALVNMSGFVRVVDALGGVRVYVTGRVEAEVSPAREGEEWIHVDISPGWHRLNGHEALAYVRERKSASDYVRMRRQRCMLKAVAAKADPVTVATRFPRIARAVSSSVKTNIPLDALPDLIEQVASLDFSDIATVGFGPPDYAPTGNHRGQPIPDIDAIRAEVQRLIHAGPDTTFATGRDSECRI